MRLCTVSTPELLPFFGVELKNRILRVTEAASTFELSPGEIEAISSVESYFQHLPFSEKVLRKLLNKITENPKTLAKPASDGARHWVEQSAVIWHPPLRRPGKFLCIGMNYRDHCEEQNKPIPKQPVVFNKFATSLIGNNAQIPLPLKVDSNVDYEAELGVVIGKKATKVTKRSAMKHVAGYMIVNDVSLRSIQKSEPQWSRAKGWDGSGPCGPSIVTADEVPDPHNLGISCKVDGELRQKSNTSEFVFTIPELISFISQLVTLEPGDIISTGTPGGVGAYRTPPGFLKDGSVVEVRIDRLGVLRNTCIAAK